MNVATATATAPVLTSAASLVVCFRCSYQSSAKGSACPRCSFPLITSSEMSPAGGIRLADVLHRDSIRKGAPPLPGVDAEPRIAQQRAEARRARRSQSHAAVQVEAPTTQPEAEAKSRVPIWNLLFVCLSAVGIGVAAAAMQTAI